MDLLTSFKFTYASSREGRRGALPSALTCSQQGHLIQVISPVRTSPGWSEGHGVGCLREIQRWRAKRHQAVRGQRMDGQQHSRPALGLALPSLPPDVMCSPFSVGRLLLPCLAWGPGTSPPLRTFISLNGLSKASVQLIVTYYYMTLTQYIILYIFCEKYSKKGKYLKYIPIFIKTTII